MEEDLSEVGAARRLHQHLVMKTEQSQSVELNDLSDSDLETVVGGLSIRFVSSGTQGGQATCNSTGGGTFVGLDGGSSGSIGACVRN